MYDMSTWTTANIVWGSIFNFIGILAIIHARRRSDMRAAVLGAVLMCYPIVVGNTYLLVVLGFALTTLLFFPRRVR